MEVNEMQRKTNTTLYVREAFSQLISQKGIEEISVKDIIERAGISRGTFYLHYLDKYDLMEKLEDDVLRNLSEIFLSSSSDNEHPNLLISYDAILESLRYVQQDFQLVYGLVTDKGSKSFIEKFKGLLIAVVKEKLAAKNQEVVKEFQIPEEYALEIVLSSILAIILLWIKKGGKESPEEITDIVMLSKKIAPIQFVNSI